MILITGVAGSGKSTVSQKLRDLGYISYEIETVPGLFHTIDKNTGKEFVDYDEQDMEKVGRAQWVCNAEKLAEILSDESSKLSFYCGTSSNIQEVMALFTKVFVLSASPENTRERLTNRTSHDFGKTVDVQNWLLGWKSDWETYMQERGAVVINSDKSVDDVAEQVLEAVKAT